jgi:hypothetical protein
MVVELSAMLTTMVCWPFSKAKLWERRQTFQHNAPCLRGCFAEKSSAPDCDGSQGSRTKRYSSLDVFEDANGLMKRRSQDCKDLLNGLD